MKLNTIEGALTVSGARFAIVATRFNGFIVERLIEGAADTLKRHGANLSDIQLVYAPGAFELPLVTKMVVEKGQYDAIIALGCVIRGATPHFDYVAGECAKGLAQLAQGKNIPITFGVLTTDTIEQAIERAGTKAGNKGVDAALTAIEMVDLFKQFGA